MAFRRTAIPFFELANNAYASGSVSFYTVDDTTNARTETLATLYSAITGSTTAANPVSLDADGKASALYAEVRVIGVVTDADGISHTTGIWYPALSTTDVAAAAASATAAATSQAAAAVSASDAAASATAAAASASIATNAAGGILINAGDTTPGNVATKLLVTAPLVVTDTTTTNATRTFSVSTASEVLTGIVRMATDAETQTGTVTGAVAITPANLSARTATATRPGLVELATAAEVKTGTDTDRAVTPAGLNALTVALLGPYTSVSGGANVTMTANIRYRFEATAAATLRFPTTYAVNDINIVEFAQPPGITMSVLSPTHTIDGVTSTDTAGNPGPIVVYHLASGVAIRSFLVGSVPLT